MPSQSLFSRVTRYKAGATLDPAENRLTECTAAVVDTIPGLGRALASWLTGEEPPGDPWVTTQQLSASGGFVDLELGFGAVTRPELLVWVEVKHGAIPTYGQLERYLADMSARRAVEHRLVLLIPTDTAVPLGLDAGVVRVVRWQTLHRELRRWLHRWKRELEPVHHWLGLQYMRFMEEEGVADPGALRSLDVVAAGRASRALSLLQKVRDGAEVLVGDAWSKSGGENRSLGGFYRHCRPAHAAEEAWLARWPVGWFEWRLTDDAHLPDATGGLVYGAGYTRNKRNLPSGDSAMAWIAANQRRGFEVVLDDQWRLYRHLRLDALLAADTLEEQASILSRFVVKAFDDLDEVPYPVDGPA